MGRLYVAGGSSEVYQVAAWIARLEQVLGQVVTYDWTKDVIRNLEKGVPDHVLPSRVRAHHAIRDLDGVRTADLIWCVVPEKPSEGMGTEIGVALALGKPWIVSGSHTIRGIFMSLATQTFMDHETAFQWIVGFLPTVRR